MNAARPGTVAGYSLQPEPDPDRPRPDAPAAVPGRAAAEVAVCYDGTWFRNAARYFACTRGAPLLISGLHDVFRQYAAQVFGCPVRRVAISHAHYVTGRHPGAVPGSWDLMLAEHGITRHDVPLTAKGEVGGDVEYALTAWQVACEASPDMMVLMTGDGDFAPLATRLARRGLRVLVPVANFSYPDQGRTVKVTTSSFLTRRATDTPALAGLIDTAARPGYPPCLHQPLPPPAAPPLREEAGPDRRYTGTVTCWNPGSAHGFITSGGQAWYAHEHEAPGRLPLAPGTLVTFTASPAAPPGRPFPAARAITPEPPGHPGPHAAATAGPGLAGTAAPAGGTGQAGRAGGWLATADSAAITRLREQAGWTRGELSRRSRIAITTLTRLENGNPRCHPRTLSLVAGALGTPPAAITTPRPAPPSGAADCDRETPG